MNKKDAVAGHDVDNILNDFLSAKLNYQNLKKENASIQLQIAENEYQLNRFGNRTKRKGQPTTDGITHHIL